MALDTATNQRSPRDRPPGRRAIPSAPVPHGPTAGAHRGAVTQEYFGTARACLRLSLITAPDLVFWRRGGGAPSSVERPADWVSTKIRAQGPPPTPISMPAALVAGRALRVPTGAAFGRPFPRPAAAGPRRLWEAARSVGTDVEFRHGVVFKSPLEAAYGTPDDPSLAGSAARPGDRRLGPRR
jgi:hypothetical protein